MSAHNTVFLRLEGPLQAWGLNSKFVIRETGDAPTKSGILGLICCAMGKGRMESEKLLTEQREPEWGPGELNRLLMGVRVDRPGVRWADYHTVGAGIGMRTAEGELKTGAKGTLLTRRYYLADASFLVALQGDVTTVAEVAAAIQDPKWPVFLGRRSCPPAVPIFAGTNECVGLLDALQSKDKSPPWRPRLVDLDGESPPEPVNALVEWRSTPGEPTMPPSVELHQDVPVSFLPPCHLVRPVRRVTVSPPVGGPVQTPCPRPARPRADYGNKQYQARRKERLDADHGLCVFCKQPAATVQHVTYRHAGGDERIEELRSLCRLCHDAVTMIEYGLGMGLDRINPEDPDYRDRIIAKRDEIIEFRSLEIRRRRLAREEVE